MDREKLLCMYRDMVRIRAFESKIVDDCFPKGMLYGNFHTCIGQEAAVVGSCYALEKKDFLTTTHRGHGHCIAKGMQTDRMMAELFGKETGYCRGRGGSLHVADVSLGILGANGIVGGGIPIATGSALASWIQGGDEVTICFFGEGASNEGAFHEAVNMAALWKLPIVYVCDNNQWAVNTPAEWVLPTPGVAERAAAYGMPGSRIDGNDVELVFETVKKAVNRARRGEGPSLIELYTFRMRAHNSADADVRTGELKQIWAAKCPIKRAREKLRNDGMEEEALKRIEEEARTEMERAYEITCRITSSWVDFSLTTPFLPTFSLPASN